MRSFRCVHWKDMASAVKHTCCLLLLALFCPAKGDVFQEALEEARLHNDLFGNRTQLDKHLRPSVHANQSTVVEIGLSLIRLFELNAQRGILETVIWIRVVWYDYSLHWNEADYGGLNVIRTKSELVWTPNYILDNNIQAGEPKLGDDKFNILIYPNGQILWVPSRKEKTACAVHLRNFPYDEQECFWKFVPVINYGHALKAQLYGKKDVIDMSDYSEADEWIVTETTAKIEKGADAIFRVHLKRRSQYYTFSLIVPLIVAWGLVLALFWLPPGAQEKVTISAFTTLFLFIQILHMYYIVPHNGTDVPRIVVFTGTTFAFAIVSLLLSLASIFLCRDSKCSVPNWLCLLVDGPCGVLLCLGPSTRGVSIGARLLSSNVELTVTPENQEPSNETKEQGDPDWTLATAALNRICFIVFCITCFTLLLSCLLG